MICLYLEAPFAVTRTFTAGWYRPTATFLSPSMVYGLLMNLCGIETRKRSEESPDYQGSPVTLLRDNLPRIDLAIGISENRIDRQGRPLALDRESDQPQFPHVTSLFQQLHTYPVGASGKEHAKRTYGNKFNITPVRRELLCDLRAIVSIQCGDELEARLVETVTQGIEVARYGIPFLGDNSYLIDRITPIHEPVRAFWYERLSADDYGVRQRATRLPLWIDRADSSKTITDIFAPIDIAQIEIPSASWVTLPPQPPN